jgi:Fe-coproporphyrin III synthase
MMSVQNKSDQPSAFDNLAGKENYLIDETGHSLILHKIGPGIKKIYLELTANCNLKCITCMRQQWSTMPEGEMDLELFSKLLEQLKSFPALEKVHLGGFGEPLAHSRALEMIRALCTAGYRVSMNTNGTLVDSDAALSLIESGVHAIYFSIDSLDSESFAQIRVNGEYDAVINNMLHLRELKQKMNVNYPKIGLEFVLMKSNIDQLPLLPKLAKEVGAPTVLVTNLLAYSEEMYREVLYDKPQTERELGAGVLAPPNWTGTLNGYRFPEPAIWPAVDNDYVFWGSLRLPRIYWGSSRRCGFVEDDTAVIRWDGAVSPCYALMYNYPYYLDNRRKEVSSYLPGNIRDESLYNIWNKSDYIRFRHRVRNFNFPSCMDCSTARICDYAEQNEDCWGNSPSCADCLWSQGIIRCP